MQRISSRVGVPRTFINRYIFDVHVLRVWDSSVYIKHKQWKSHIHTLIISTNWSTALSPGNKGCKKITHQNTTKSFALTLYNSLIPKRIFGNWYKKIILRYWPHQEAAQQERNQLTIYQSTLYILLHQRWALEHGNNESKCMICWAHP